MSEKSDAATATDDMKMPPLCLFYFSHPFGILSPDPPTVTQAPPDYIPSSWKQNFDAKSWQQSGIRVSSYHAGQTDSPSETEHGYPIADDRRNIVAPAPHIHCHQDKTCTARYGKQTCLNIPQTDHIESRCRNKHVNYRRVIQSTCTATQTGVNGDRMKSLTANWKCKDFENTINRGFSCVQNATDGLSWIKQKYRNDTRYLNCERSNTCYVPYNSTAYCNNKRQNNLPQTLPPLERSLKQCCNEARSEPSDQVRPGVRKFNSFRTKAFLPPIELQHCHHVSPRHGSEEGCGRSHFDSIPEPMEREFDNPKSPKMDCVGAGRRRVKKRRRIRPVKSSRGVNKGRIKPNRSAARKLVSCLLQSVHSGRRVPTASLPALTEVLNTVRAAWASPTSLLTRAYRQRSPPSAMPGPRERGAASPGMLRRRYSVPETVMRKYKLAQQKSESDESEVGSAPSPRGWSPARRGGARGHPGAARPSPLLRRLWGRQGGSHSELRYWDSCSASSDNCEACRKLSDKNIPVAVKTEAHPPSPIHKTYRTSRSPKKMIPFASQGFSPERYITHLENARDMLLRESKSQITSPSLLASASTPSERSSFKTASITEGSPKLRLSSLATSSYPTTDVNSVSDITSEITRSSTSYSSDDVTHSRSKTSTNRPETAGVSCKNELSDAVSGSPKKRRQSVCIFMNSFDSPTAEIKSSTITDTSAPLSQGSCSNEELRNSDAQRDKLQTPNRAHADLEASSRVTTSTQPTTSSSEKTTTKETSDTTPSSVTQETSPGDSAVSTRSSITTSFSGNTDKDPSITTTPSSVENKNEGSDTKYRNNIINTQEFSDTGISETIVNDCDSNKNYINSTDDSDHKSFNSRSVSVSDNISTTDINSDAVVTCVENPAYNKLSFNHLKNSKLECLEVVVSETLNSSAFLDNKKINDLDVHENNNKIDEISDKAKILSKEYTLKPNCTIMDIDQYVSNILIDSLNSMTDQINEINLNTEDEFKLNILEKEIKVKLQNVCASPINLPSNTMISSLLTQIPDKDLLETTIIEEKSHSLTYSTESTLFPAQIQNQTELHEDTPDAEVYQDSSYYVDSDMNNMDEGNIIKYSDLLEPQESFLNDERNTALSVNKEVLNNNVDVNSYSNNIVENVPNNAHFYLSESNNFTDHENNKNNDIFENEKPSKAVLQKLNKMFENSTNSINASIDSNYNVCLDDSTNNYFCGSVYKDISHLEMSTDVDIFVDNSLNKMMNSIDASDLCSGVRNISLNNQSNISENNENSIYNLTDSIESKKESSFQNSRDVNPKSNVVISNIGSGSLYQKPPQVPIVVPRFSAIPHSESMEVNTSSEDDDSSCESDCLSMVDSLDDPNSPRQLENDLRLRKKMSKHDNTLVRGDIMSLLPENSNINVSKLPKDKCETFFVPIKEDAIECEKDNIVVAEHMPEKIKEKLFKRQQKRELRKEHFKRKKMRQLKKEFEKQKAAEIQKLREEHEKDCLEILGQLIDQVVEKVNKEGTNPTNQGSKSPVKRYSQDIVGQKNNEKKLLHRPDKQSRKVDNNVKEFESFVIDKQGNVQLTNKPIEQIDQRMDGSKKSDSSKCVNNNVKRNSQNLHLQNYYDFQQPSYNPNLSGPRRLYQKTEFKEGNKHVEILEIVECIDSSPEPLSDDNQNYLRFSKKIKKSKIPVPVAEKLHKISKNKSMQKSSKRCRSPNNKVPFNISTAKIDQNNLKNVNSSMDQLIASILIDAFNDDAQDNGKHLNLSSSLNKKPAHPVVKKLSADTSGRRASIPQQTNDKLAFIPKYKQKFDAIPEERSSVSMESSNEDVTKANRRPSLPSDIKLQQTDVSAALQNNPICQKSYMSDILEINETDTKRNANVEDGKIRIASPLEHQSPPKYVATKNDVETQSTPIRKNLNINDASTSPLPQYMSIATSPISIEKTDGGESRSQQIKGKKALGTREGWDGFCRPQTGYSPEHEGSHPSSNTPSDREAVEKISTEDAHKDPAPHSQRILRTVDSRNNIRQISIHHKPPIPEKLTSKSKEVASDIKIEKKIEKRNANDSDHPSHSNRERKIGDTSDEKYSKLPERNKHATYSNKHKKDHMSEVGNSYTNFGKIGQNKLEIKLQKSESNESVENKRIRLPSPFMNQSFSRSTDTTSSGSDSDAGVTCPALVPRWLPNNNLRNRRNFNRKNQRKEEPFRLPHQNAAGGWSVTLAGSCFTTLPSDVEMKVIFPKNTQQANSQSDSGLGEEQHYRKQNSVVCKKCGAGESLCQNCRVSQSCTCISLRSQETVEKENESFLPPALIRNGGKNSKLVHAGSMEQLTNLPKSFQYLPEVAAAQGSKNKTKRSTGKMARRFSLHCWLPEDKLPGKPKVAKMQITQSIGNENDEELSVFGCAIMPETKPRVPTMSERDLTRVHTAQMYSRNRRF